MNIDTPVVDALRRNRNSTGQDMYLLARELERHARALAADLENEEQRNLARSKALTDWRAFCEEKLK